MNLLLLGSDEVRDDGTALLTGRRHEHASAVLRVLAGETLRVGVRGGRCGTGQVLSEGAEGPRLRVTLDAEPPPRAGVSLVLAMPRPKARRRVARRRPGRPRQRGAGGEELLRLEGAPAEAALRPLDGIAGNRL